MFSVIIPLYNKAPYIEKAIKSVASQTYKEIELIVINDGSTDDSLEKLHVMRNELQEFNSELYSNLIIVEQPNMGVSTTRNNGVKIAKYDYITFLDADDWWEPTFLEEMKGLIDEFPQAGIYGSSYFKVRNGHFIPANIGVDKGFQKGFIEYFRVYAKTIWMPLTSISVVIPKKIFIELNGFKPELKLGEDFHLWTRIASKYKVAFLNKQLSNYNQDVDVVNRAVEEKLYLPNEHSLFEDYSFIDNNTDFSNLYEVLAVYGLMPYYLAKKNKSEVDKILDSIHWRNHKFKYKLYYRILPLLVVKKWYDVLKFGSKLKRVF